MGEVVGKMGHLGAHHSPAGARRSEQAVGPRPACALNDKRQFGVGSRGLEAPGCEAQKSVALATGLSFILPQCTSRRKKRARTS